ncbi:hypothetical protein CHS0354_022684 [Potamilus streckersoni]|uniref:Uncharacterized protein n=1 Tax=Potamilus streckersoni TaxID=2493646 RepID=A0AAE0S6Z6_9BIVA|nr:hypothetical protein CHS0354_022684 [Potamilus streckersoni]
MTLMTWDEVLGKDNVVISVSDKGSKLKQSFLSMKLTPTSTNNTAGRLQGIGVRKQWNNSNRKEKCKCFCYDVEDSGDYDCEANEKIKNWHKKQIPDINCAVRRNACQYREEYSLFIYDPKRSKNQRPQIIDSQFYQDNVSGRKQQLYSTVPSGYQKRTLSSYGRFV